MTNFHLTAPSLDAEWRAIILFGRNVASYKFALALSLIELADAGRTDVGLSDLAEPFSRHLCDHLKIADKQATSRSSKFLDACRAYNTGEIDKAQLIEATVRNGFNNVIDAFHVVNQRETPSRFFVDERKAKGGITLTDHVHTLKETFQGHSLGAEVQSRWRLVETAWSLDLSRNLLPVEATDQGDELFVRGARRVNITSSRGALNGYQKGRCFYCFSEISIQSDHPRLADVDHFFPWVLKRETSRVDVDGVWNLVLACRDCNRGEGGKMARVPSLRLLARLHRRNSYLIESHHPLRETLMMQTGKTEQERRDFLQRRHAEAVQTLIHQWEPRANAPAVF